MSIEKEGDSCRKCVYYKERSKKSRVGRTLFSDWSYAMFCNHKAYSKVINMAYASNISIFITNSGDFKINYDFQCSADNINFIDEGNQRVILPNESVVLVPMYFAKYGRVKFNSDSKILVVISVQEQIYG